MTDARQEILTRIRSTSRGAAGAAPRAYRSQSTAAGEARTALFCARAGDYRAEVRRVKASEVAESVGEVLAMRGAKSVAVPSGLPAGWRPGSVELVEGDRLSPRQLDALDGVVTGCTIAIAETGTIALTAASAEGPRVLTLIPDVHVCIVEERQIVELVPEAMRRLGVIVRAERRPVTMISGPSATSDIELSRVEGVHGPRDLVIIVSG